jgi:N-carbamoyl-L-amino-acid hydrolase
MALSLEADAGRQAESNPAPDTDRLLQRLASLAEFGATPAGGVHRVAFSEEDVRARGYVKRLMREAGLSVRTDAAGNIIGRRDGREPGLPALLCGSHLDTVPHGGRYDGALGVLCAIECAQVLEDHGISTRHPLEVIVFTDEEGGLVGSRAMAGSLSADALDIVSHSGKSIRQGIESLGGNPADLRRAARKKGDIRAFLEVHVEQGAVLDARGIDIGIVEGIVGINRWDVTVEGMPNHAGTTPMDMRRDALLAAARLIIAVNEVIRSRPGDQVGTVGRIEAEPGAPNVIPGRVTMSLELRDLSSDKIQWMFDAILERAEGIAADSGTSIFMEPVDAGAAPAPTHPWIRDMIERSARELGLSTLRMPSGAGHDAQELARLAPIGMIFVPSVGGISHSPREYSRDRDVANAADVLLRALLLIDRDQDPPRKLTDR